MKLKKTVEKRGVVRGHKKSRTVHQSIFRTTTQVYGVGEPSDKDPETLTPAQSEEIERKHKEQMLVVNRLMKENPGKYRVRAPESLSDLDAGFDLTYLFKECTNHFVDCLKDFGIELPDNIKMAELNSYVKARYSDTDEANRAVFIASEGLFWMMYAESEAKAGRLKQALTQVLRQMPRYGMVALAKFEPTIVLGLSTKAAKRKSAGKERNSEINEILRELAGNDDSAKNLWRKFYGLLDCEGFKPREEEGKYFYMVGDKEKKMAFSTFRNSLSSIRNPKLPVNKEDQSD